MTSRKKKIRCTTILKSEALNLFQNNRVNSLSLLFFVTSPVQIQCPSLSSVHDTCIPSPSFCLFAYMYFRIFAANSDNSNFFRFQFSLEGSSCRRESTVYHKNTPLLSNYTEDVHKGSGQKKSTQRGPS